MLSPKDDEGSDVPRSPSGALSGQKSGVPTLNPFLPERPANPPPLSAAKTSSLRLKAQAAQQVVERLATRGAECEDPNGESSRGRSGLAPRKPPVPPPQQQKKKSTNPFLSDSDEDEEEEEEAPPEIPFRNNSKSPTGEDDGNGSLRKGSNNEADKPPVPAPRFYSSGGVIPPYLDPEKSGSRADASKALSRPSQSSKKSRPPPPPSSSSQQGGDSRDASPARVGGAPAKVAAVVSVLSSQ